MLCVIAVIGFFAAFHVIDYFIGSTYYVELVKKSRLDNSKYTYEEAFGHYFNGDWEYSQDDFGNEYVSYVGTDEANNEFVAEWTITALGIKEIYSELTYCSYAGVSLLDGDVLEGMTLIGLYAIMNN